MIQHSLEIYLFVLDICDQCGTDVERLPSPFFHTVHGGNFEMFLDKKAIIHCTSFLYPKLIT